MLLEIIVCVQGICLAAVTIFAIRALVKRDSTWTTSALYIEKILGIRKRESATKLALWDQIRARRRAKAQEDAKGIPIEEPSLQRAGGPFDVYDDGLTRAALEAGEIAGIVSEDDSLGKDQV